MLVKRNKISLQDPP